MRVPSSKRMRWPPTRILAGTDFSSTARAAAEVAACVARRTGASVELAHVVRNPAERVTGYTLIDELLVTSPDPEELRADAMDRLAREAEAVGLADAGRHALLGEPAAELVALRDRLAADLLVLGGRGLRGLRRFLLGSVADRVLRAPGAPLLLVREAPRGREFRRLLVGLQLPDQLSPALRLAVAAAHDLLSELTVVHVLPPRGYLSDLRHVELHPDTGVERVEKTLAGIDRTVPVQIMVEHGDPAGVIPAVARRLGADLVVLGAETDAGGWPGRVTDRVARAGVPSLLIVWTPPGGVAASSGALEAS